MWSGIEWPTDRVQLTNCSGKDDILKNESLMMDWSSLNCCCLCERSRSFGKFLKGTVLLWNPGWWTALPGKGRTYPLYCLAAVGFTRELICLLMLFLTIYNGKFSKRLSNSYLCSPKCLWPFETFLLELNPWPLCLISLWVFCHNISNNVISPCCALGGDGACASHITSFPEMD